MTGNPRVAHRVELIERRHVTLASPAPESSRLVAGPLAELSDHRNEALPRSARDPARAR
jgi:hypothetical protein